ncbi:tripartite motif-containing protein 16-like [Melanotaenia boesemani]|uniref:tripartite motif-containing protein 16-like n=1 Tax=Melanotaenia boesemani TaxID=1250792 RepID=UPI001C048C1D|nr:tripartite motif-containing protein 16-like [Melanotaenia boesemani]
MEQKKVKLDEEGFSCSICMDLMNDPATIACGHSYCMECIKTHWDEEERRRFPSCPQCRETFTPRPVLVKNVMLAALVDELKMTGEAAPAAHHYAGPEDVACDVCPVKKLKATKYCLVCLASYCEKHLQPHHDAPPLQKHKLVDPSQKLQEQICSVHNEVIKIFCRTDQRSICYLCLMNEHKGHETASVPTERAEKQKELEVRRKQIQQRIQDEEKDVKLLQQEVEAINGSADKAVEDSEKIFTELIRLIQKRRSDVKQQIRSQQETEVTRVKELQDELKQEITELKWKDAKLVQLSHTEDHNHFLHNYPTVAALGEARRSPSITDRPLTYFKNVTAAVSKCVSKLQGILTEKWKNISWAIVEADVLLPPAEPKTRAEFIKCSCDVTLDPDTANPHLSLSEGNRKAKLMEQQLFYPDHPNRFTSFTEVLSRDPLPDRCYFEVEWIGSSITVAVTYINITRPGMSLKSIFGCNEISWAMACGKDCYAFWHNDVKLSIFEAQSFRIGVYVYQSQGILSFYSVSKSRMTLLHRVQTTFSQPLYAGLRFYYSYGDTAEFIKLK